MITIRKPVIIAIILTIVAVAVWSNLPLTPTVRGHQWRENLQLCVQSLDGTSIDATKPGKIISGFEEVKKHPSFKEAHLDRGIGPTFTVGCPGEPTIFSPTWYGPKIGAGLVPANSPSEFNIYIYIASVEDLQRAFGDTFPRITTQEIMCNPDDGVCGEVSTRTTHHASKSNYL